MRQQWKLILTIILIIFIVIFALQNTATVEVDFFFGTVEAPMVLVMLLSVLLGVIIGLLASVAAIKSNHKSNKDLQKQVKQQKERYHLDISEKDKELSSLRSTIRDLEQSRKNALVYDEIPAETEEVDFSNTETIEAESTTTDNMTEATEIE